MTNDDDDAGRQHTTDNSWLPRPIGIYARWTKDPLMNPLHLQMFLEQNLFIRVNSFKVYKNSLFLCFALDITLPYKKHNVLQCSAGHLWDLHGLFSEIHNLCRENLNELQLSSYCQHDVVTSHTWRWVFADTSNLWLTVYFVNVESSYAIKGKLLLSLNLTT